MKKMGLLISLFIVFSGVAQAADYKLLGYDFIAPAVFDRTTVSSNSQVGLIVLDTLDGNFYGMNASGSWSALSTSGIVPEVVVLRDEKTNTTPGGTFTSGSYVTRTLSVLANPLSYSWVTLASNQFTLTAGTYEIHAEGLAYDVDHHKIKIRNVTDSSDAIIGLSAYASSSSSVGSSSSASGVITITATKTFALQHQCQTTKTTNGFGIDTDFGDTEVYAQVRIAKIK